MKASGPEEVSQELFTRCFTACQRMAVELQSLQTRAGKSVPSVDCKTLISVVPYFGGRGRWLIPVGEAEGQKGLDT